MLEIGYVDSLKKLVIKIYFENVVPLLTLELQV